MKNRQVKLVLIVFVYLTSLSFRVFCVSCVTAFTPETQFEIPEYGGQINFDVGGSYLFVSLDENTWNFVGLVLDTYVLNTTAGGGSSGVVYGTDVLQYARNDGNFSVSVQNCNITITNLDLIMNYAPRIGWLNYTVNGVGSQTFNLHYFLTGFGPWYWSVYIDGEYIPQNEGWTLTNDDILTVTSANTEVCILYQNTKPLNLGEPSILNPIEEYGFIIVIFLFSLCAIIITVVFLRKRKEPSQILIKK